MYERRRGRPPLPLSNAAPVIPVENAEGVPSTGFDAEQVPLAEINGEHTESTSKGAVDLILLLTPKLYYNSKGRVK
jgi:hypothetical protein